MALENLDITGKRVLVMGLGRFGGGTDAAAFAAAQGARVTVTDLAEAERLGDSLERLKVFDNIKYQLGHHDPADFQNAQMIIVNPAVPQDHAYLQSARQQGVPITTQINLFLELCPGSVIGITGANGKSTTTALTAHLLGAGIEAKAIPHRKVWLGGNIGNRPLLSSVSEMCSSDLVVLELSSFQTDELDQIRRAPKVSLLTNLTPNHLDRHGTFADYCAAKEKLFVYQTLDREDPAVSFFCADDTMGRQWYEKYGSQAGRHCVLYRADDVTASLRARFRLPGRANLSNLAGALAIARSLGVTEAVIERCLPDFHSLPHRLEWVGQIDQVQWYNDSIATTPESTMVALEAFAQPKLLIAGGYDKGVSFTSLGSAIARQAKAAILLGQTAGKLAQAIEACPDQQIHIEQVGCLDRAVAQARQMAGPGDVVLLSPACASYDMFDNFQQRGDAFRRLVMALDEL